MCLDVVVQLQEVCTWLPLETLSPNISTIEFHCPPQFLRQIKVDGWVVGGYEVG